MTEGCGTPELLPKQAILRDPAWYVASAVSHGPACTFARERRGHMCGYGAGSSQLSFDDRLNVLHTPEQSWPPRGCFDSCSEGAVLQEYTVCQESARKPRQGCGW